MSEYDNDFLDNYMQLVEETESPRVFHLWSALSGVAACVGRRVWLPFGFTEMYPNMYILLVGPAASRKNTAINIMQKFLRKATGVKFAQDDCAGKKQGIIAAMAGQDEQEIEDDQLTQQLHTLASLAPEQALKAIANVVIPGPKKTPEGMSKNKDDKFSLYITATEFTAFTGQNNLEFIQFLTKVYDGEPYIYRLKNKKEEFVMDNPMVNLLGGTTPTNIADSLPTTAIGEGFTSRVILVFGSRKYKSIPRPDSFDETLQQTIQKRYSEIYYNLSGELQEAPDAKQFANGIYERRNSLTDGRFTYYLGRRHTHFLKIGMLFACARMSKMVEIQDYLQADALLTSTEKFMPDALGEFGMSPLAAASQKIVEFINFSREPVTVQMLWAFMHRDLRMHELSNVLNDLQAANRIQQTKSMITGNVVYIPNVDGGTVDKITLMDTQQTSASTETLQ